VAAEQETQISLEEFQLTLRVLRACRDNYEPQLAPESGWSKFAEAERMVIVEARSQHGADALAALGL
jgi:hypothetical protein